MWSIHCIIFAHRGPVTSAHTSRTANERRCGDVQAPNSVFCHMMHHMLHGPCALHRYERA